MTYNFKIGDFVELTREAAIINAGYNIIGYITDVHHVNISEHPPHVHLMVVKTEKHEIPKELAQAFPLIGPERIGKKAIFDRFRLKPLSPAKAAKLRRCSQTRSLLPKDSPGKTT